MTTIVLRGRAAGTLADEHRELRELWGTDPATGMPTPEWIAWQRKQGRRVAAIDCANKRYRAARALTALAEALREGKF